MQLDVKQLMAGSREGFTLRTSCDDCGGSDTLTITNTGEVYVYNCYRASCNNSGAVPINLDFATRRENLFKRKEARAEEWQVPGYFVDGIGNDLCLKYMESKHMMEAYKEGLFRPMYDPALRRFVFPIRDSQGKVKGAVGRALDTKAFPKVHNYNASYTQPFICGNYPDVVLVEDCASAVSVTRANISGLALLGTNIRKDFIPYIAKFNRVFIALDADAYSKSFKLKKELTAYVKNVSVIRIKEDIKDQPNLTLEIV